MRSFNKLVQRTTTFVVLSVLPLAHAAHMSEEASYSLGGGFLGLGIGAVAGVLGLALFRMHWLARIGAALTIWFGCVFAGLLLGALKYTWDQTHKPPVVYSAPIQSAPIAQPQPEPVQKPLNDRAVTAVQEAVVAGGGTAVQLETPQTAAAPAAVQIPPAVAPAPTAAAAQPSPAGTQKAAYKPPPLGPPVLSDGANALKDEWNLQLGEWTHQDRKQPAHYRNVRFEGSPLRIRLGEGHTEPFIFDTPLFDFEKQHYGQIVSSEIQKLQPLSYVAAMKRYAQLVRSKHAVAKGTFGYCTLARWALVYKLPEDRDVATKGVEADLTQLCGV